ncbi:MAG: hypothetical protein HY652_03700 [Acidobacteria bacterium]|nr:hypothetical protein [Acidobacteriota bacterium]
MTQEQRRAERLVLQRLRPHCPPLPAGQILDTMVGETLKEGDRVASYRVLETVPEGPVLVTVDTRIELR